MTAGHEKKAVGLYREVLFRGIAVAALGVFATRALSLWLEQPQRVSLLLLLMAETLTVLIAVFARRANAIATDPLSIFATVLATCYFVFLGLDSGHALVPRSVSAFLQSAGLVWQIFAKLSLGRSFGLLPAARGIVTGGAYRFVRHPIYAGYLLAHVGFALDNFTARNLLVLSALYGLQWLRLIGEERVLSTDPSYCEYRRRVPWRVLPGLF
jgi:protein-S-isoprenylcysteine O-methyltransferase Ste14